MPRLSNAERNQAVGMLQAGQSKRQVARHFHCSPSTVSRLWQRYVETDSVDDRPRPGREKVKTPEQDQYIVTQHLRDRFRTATQTAAETPGIRQPRISASTVRRRLHQVNLSARSPAIVTLLTPLRQPNRLNWARIHQNWTQIQWRGVLFSDESRFCVFTLDRRDRVWRRPGERYAACCINQHNRWGGEGVMVWAAITFDHKSPLVVIQGNMTALCYIAQVLRPTLLPLLAQHRDVITFQQDNARPHTARISMAFLGEHGVNVLPWPAYSPDMSPIEHLWDQLGRRIRNLNPRPLTRPQLIAALHAEWPNIPQDSIRRLIRSMRRRCRACVAQHGGHTPY